MKFEVRLEEVGDWKGMEREAMDCWNSHVAPVLERIAAADAAEHLADIASREFFESAESESWARLGPRVATLVHRLRSA